MRVESIKDFMIGFLTVGPILIIQGYITQTQFFDFIPDIRTALMVSLALSVVIFIAYVSLSIYVLFKLQRPIIFVGSLISIVLAYFLFHVVREGFAIFFEFI